MTIGETVNVNVRRIGIETGEMVEGMTDEETSVSILVPTEEMKDVEKNRRILPVTLLKSTAVALPSLHNHHHHQLVRLIMSCLIVTSSDENYRFHQIAT